MTDVLSKFGAKMGHYTKICTRCYCTYLMYAMHELSQCIIIQNYKIYEVIQAAIL
jgi:hypothetical protein